MSIYEDNDPRSVLEAGVFDIGHVVLGTVAAHIDPCLVGSETINVGVGAVDGPDGFLIMAEFHHSQN